MLKIKVKTPERKIFIPVPYCLLHVAIIFLSSEYVTKRLNDRQREGEREKLEGKPMNQDGAEESNSEEQKNESSTVVTFFTPETKKIMKRILKEMKLYRGLELISVQSKDTFVSIKL